MRYFIRTTIILLMVYVNFVPSRLSAEIVDMVAARVNDEVILLSDVRMRLKQVAGITDYKQIAEQKKEKMERSILESIIEERLLVQYAKDKKFEMPDEEINKTLYNIKRDNNLTDRQLKEILERDGIVMGDYRRILKEQKMISMLMNQEVNSKVTLEETEKQEFYAEHKNEFVTPAEIRVRHILFIVRDDSLETESILTKKRAEDVLSRVKNGEDFAKLARQYSDDGSAESGGDLGFFSKGRMIKEFEDIAFSLRPGEISGIVKTGFGYHIIKCEEKKESVQIGFQEALHEIERRLFTKKADARRKAFMDRLKSEAAIERRF